MPREYGQRAWWDGGKRIRRFFDWAQHAGVAAAAQWIKRRAPQTFTMFRGVIHERQSTGQSAANPLSECAPHE